MTPHITCPHCEARFKVPPILVYRAVRCAHCKGPFRIDADESSDQGVRVSRINMSTTIVRKESRVQLPSSRPSAALSPRRNIKVEQAKKSMQLAVESATQAKLACEEGEVSATPQKKRSAKSRVVITNSGNKQHQLMLRSIGLVGVFTLSVLCVLVFLPSNPKRQALRDFTITVAENEVAYPYRLPAYQSRFVFRSRDGLTNIPVVLNVDQSDLADEFIFDWQEVSEFIQSKIVEMSCNRQLGFYYYKKDEAVIGEIVDRVVDLDGDMELLYKEIRQNDITMVLISDLLQQMRAREFDERLLYVASVLLASSKGAEYLFGDNVPVTLKVCAFAGKDGQVLFDENGIYNTYNARAYEGLLINFPENEGFGEAWKILDVCLLDHVDSMYQARNNPLAQQANRVSLTNGVQ